MEINVAATFENAESANTFRLRCLFMWVPIFVWVLINGDVVVVIRMGAYIHGVLILCGCLLSLFYGMNTNQELDSHSEPQVGIGLALSVEDYRLDCNDQKGYSSEDQYFYSIFK